MARTIDSYRPIMPPGQRDIGYGQAPGAITPSRVPTPGIQLPSGGFAPGYAAGGAGPVYALNQGPYSTSSPASHYGSRGLIPNPEAEGASYPGMFSTAGQNTDPIVSSLPPVLKARVMVINDELKDLQSDMDQLKTEEKELKTKIAKANTQGGKDGDKTKDGVVTKVEGWQDDLSSIRSEMKDLRDKIREAEGERNAIVYRFAPPQTGGFQGGAAIA